MNDFFIGLRVLFARLHVVLSILLIIWEIVGQNIEGADTPIRIVAQLFNLTSVYYSFFILSALLFSSHLFWGYMLGSFISEPRTYIPEEQNEGFIQGFFDVIGGVALVLILMGLLVSLDAFITL